MVHLNQFLMFQINDSYFCDNVCIGGVYDLDANTHADVHTNKHTLASVYNCYNNVSFFIYYCPDPPPPKSNQYAIIRKIFMEFL